MATITADDIHLSSSLSLGSGTQTDTFSITTTQYLNIPPAGHNFIWFDRSSSFYRIQLEIPSSTKTSIGNNVVSSIEIQLNGVGATHTNNDVNNTDQYYIKTGLKINTDNAIPENIGGSNTTFKTGSLNFEENETYNNTSGEMTLVNLQDVKLKELIFDSTTSSTTGDLAAGRMTDWTGLFASGSNYYVEVEPRSTHNSNIHFGFESADIIIKSGSLIPASSSIDPGDINLSTSFNAEFNDTNTASWESKSRTTDYRRPLLIRQNDAIGVPIADRYGSRDNYGSSDYSRYGAVMPFHKPSTHMPANAVNHIRFDTIAAQFDLADIPNDAVITAAKVKIVVQQKSGGMDTPRSPYNYNTGVAGGTPITDGSFYGRIETSFSASSSDNVYFGILDGTSDAQAVLRDDTLQTLVFNLYTDYNYPTGFPQYSNFDTFDISTRPYGPLGTHPIVNIQLSSVYPTPFTGGNYSGGVYGAYEFHNIALQIEYTGRAYNTTGFVKQAELSQIIPSDELNYRNTHFLLGATGVPAYGLGFSYSSTLPTTEWHIKSGANNDILDIHNNNKSWGVTSNNANPSNYQDLWHGNTSKELLMIGSTAVTDYRTDAFSSVSQEVLSTSDVRDSNFKIHRYNFNTSTYESEATTWPLFTPRYNVAYLGSMGGLIDLDMAVSLAATPILFHRNTADEIDDFALNVSTTIFGGYLLEPDFDTMSAKADLENTGLAGLIFAGEANLSAGFTNDFAGDVAITGVVVKAFDTTLTNTALGTVVAHTTDAEAQRFEFNITRALGGIIRSSPVVLNTAFESDIDDVYVISIPTLQQIHTEQTETRTFLIPLQGRDRAHERHLFIEAQTRTFKIPLQGTDRAHERHLFIDQQTRTITAEALEE